LFSEWIHILLRVCEFFSAVKRCKITDINQYLIELVKTFCGDYLLYLKEHNKVLESHLHQLLVNVHLVHLISGLQRYNDGGCDGCGDCR